MHMELNDYLIDDRRSQKLDFISKINEIAKRIPVFSKIKDVKRSKLIAFAVVIVLAISLLFGQYGTKETTVLSSTDIADTEERLALVLSQIEGVGKVQVMISYEGGMKKVIAYDTTTSNDRTSNGDKETEYVSENKSPVTVNVSGTSTPLVLQELKPEITGVIVVAEGARNLKVRLDLASAVQTVLNISSEKVEVFTMNN